MATDVERAFREHNESLYRYVLRMTRGDEATARDAVQHAFLRLMERPPAHDNVKAWLYQVATRAVFDWSSSERRRASLLEASAREDDAATEPTPDDALEQRDRLERLTAALEALPERDRAILLMRSEGFKHREIADAIGTTTGSIGTMAARALDRLSALLGPDEAGETTR